MEIAAENITQSVYCQPLSSNNGYARFPILDWPEVLVHVSLQATFDSCQPRGSHT